MKTTLKVTGWALYALCILTIGPVVTYNFVIGHDLSVWISTATIVVTAANIRLQLWQLSDR